MTFFRKVKDVSFQIWLILKVLEVSECVSLLRTEVLLLLPLRVLMVFLLKGRSLLGNRIFVHLPGQVVISCFPQRHHRNNLKLYGLDITVGKRLLLLEKSKGVLSVAADKVLKKLKAPIALDCI